jgi:hypothetical protein
MTGGDSKKMTNDDARDLAEKVLASTDLRGYSAAFHGCRKSTLSEDEWDVVYDLVAPTGQRVGGGLVVIVDGKTRQARVADDL